jgi:predicted DNA binding CopG/RHH family protein
MNLKPKIKNLIKRLPYIRSLNQEVLHLRQELDNFNKNACFPPGHYYSPIALVHEIKKREAEIWKDNEQNKIKGINLRPAEQLSLLNHLSEYYAELPFQAGKQPKIRYQL